MKIRATKNDIHRLTMAYTYKVYEACGGRPASHATLALAEQILEATNSLFRAQEPMNRFYEIPFGVRYSDNNTGQLEVYVTDLSNVLILDFDR
jgi:hypothetical protein